MSDDRAPDGEPPLPEPLFPVPELALPGDEPDPAQMTVAIPREELEADLAAWHPEHPPELAEGDHGHNTGPSPEAELPPELRDAEDAAPAESTPEVPTRGAPEGLRHVPADEAEAAAEGYTPFPMAEGPALAAPEESPANSWPLPFSGENNYGTWDSDDYDPETGDGAAPEPSATDGEASPAWINHGSRTVEIDGEPVSGTVFGPAGSESPLRDEPLPVRPLNPEDRGGEPDLVRDPDNPEGPLVDPRLLANQRYAHEVMDPEEEAALLVVSNDGPEAYEEVGPPAIAHSDEHDEQLDELLQPPPSPLIPVPADPLDRPAVSALSGITYLVAAELEDGSLIARLPGGSRAAVFPAGTLIQSEVEGS